MIKLVILGFLAYIVANIIIVFGLGILSIGALLPVIIPLSPIWTIIGIIKIATNENLMLNLGKMVANKSLSVWSNSKIFYHMVRAMILFR
jgi:hypothetical protein